MARKGLVILSHWLMAMALLPVVWASIKTCVSMVPFLAHEGFRAWWVYGFGILTYVLIDRFIAQPMTLYVVGHELTHAVSGLMMGARIHSFKANAKGGEVRLSKTNTLISLSPYIVPIYALIVMALYWALKHWWNTSELRWGFQFFFGAAVMFHLSMTLRAIHGRQPDLRGKGFFLSLALILLGNSLILGLFFVGLFGHTPTLDQYGMLLLRESKQAFFKLANWTASLWWFI